MIWLRLRARNLFPSQMTTGSAYADDPDASLIVLDADTARATGWEAVVDDWRPGALRRATDLLARRGWRIEASGNLPSPYPSA